MTDVIAAQAAVVNSILDRFDRVWFVGLVVPSESQGVVIPQTELEKRVQSVQILFSRLFGGSTRLDGLSFAARGSWLSPAGKLINERVFLVCSFVDLSSRADTMCEFVSACQGLGRLWRQQAMGVVVNGSFTDFLI